MIHFYEQGYCAHYSERQEWILANYWQMDDLIRSIIEERPQAIFSDRERDRRAVLEIQRMIWPHWVAKLDKLLEKKAKRFLAIERSDVFTMPESERPKKYKEMQHLEEEIELLYSMREGLEHIYQLWEDRYFNQVERFQHAITQARHSYESLMKDHIILSEIFQSVSDSHDFYIQLCLDKIEQQKRLRQ